MQVQIKGETKQLAVQTITLQPEDGDNMYAFHCLNCGNFHQKIGGKVSKIYPVYEPSSQVPVVSRCRNCGSEYTFQTHDGYSSDKIRVVLNPHAALNYFYCYKGKDKLLEYTTTYIRSLDENRLRIAPFFATCPNPLCETVYYFVKMV